MRAGHGHGPGAAATAAAPAAAAGAGAIAAAEAEAIAAIEAGSIAVIGAGAMIAASANVPVEPVNAVGPAWSGCATGRRIAPPRRLVPITPMRAPLGLPPPPPGNGWRHSMPALPHGAPTRPGTPMSARAAHANIISHNAPASPSWPKASMGPKCPRRPMSISAPPVSDRSDRGSEAASDMDAAPYVSPEQPSSSESEPGSGVHANSDGVWAEPNRFSPTRREPRVPTTPELPPGPPPPKCTAPRLQRCCHGCFADGIQFAFNRVQVLTLKCCSNI